MARGGTRGTLQAETRELEEENEVEHDYVIPVRTDCSLRTGHTMSGKGAAQGRGVGETWASIVWDVERGVR